MQRYLWHAVQDDGSVVVRWNPDGTENRPDPWRTRQFHLIPLLPGLQPLSLFVPKGAQFRYAKRRHTDFGASGQVIAEGVDVLYVLGWCHPDLPDAACYSFLLPDGRIEQAADWNHVTRYERNLDEHPLTSYEGSWAIAHAAEQWSDIFADAEITEAFGPGGAKLPG